LSVICVKLDRRVQVLAVYLWCHYRVSGHIVGGVRYRMFGFSQRRKTLGAKRRAYLIFHTFLPSSNCDF